jgi:D-xylose transport system substrate-binding protein
MWMVRFSRRGLVAAALLTTLVLAAAACGDDDDDTTDAGGATTTAAGGAATTAAGGAATTAAGGGGATAESGKIALLLPESKTARYESHDRPLFEAAIKAACPNCEVLYSNADQDSAKQQTQAEAALTNGAQVMVLDPVDAKASAAIVQQAKAKNVPVVSYDRLVSGAAVDFYVSYDNEKVGTLQGQALVDKLKEDGKTSGDIVMINGAPTDGNAALFKSGAHSVLDASGFTIAAETDTVEWSPDNAQKDMDGHITKVGKDKIVGVYAANDGTAGGAIAAMKAAGINPLPPVTGQDAELAGIQRILAGEQYMTIYKAINPEAAAAAQAAIELLNGDPVSGATSTMNNDAADIPTLLFDPVVVTADNIQDTVVKDGYWKASDICTGAFAAACTTAGIS